MPAWAICAIIDGGVADVLIPAWGSEVSKLSSNLPNHLKFRSDQVQHLMSCVEIEVLITNRLQNGFD
jgi:hypothetical protein